jgi:DNA-binding transcriptional regulator YdaS (Cro superfamily)
MNETWSRKPRAIMGDGVYYPSAAAAARRHGVTPSAVKQWIEGTPRYPQTGRRRLWRWATEEEIAQASD